MNATHGNKTNWSLQEDESLLAAVNVTGPKNWSVISNCVPGRTGKQCRERYKNHLDPSLKKGPFTREEDVIIVQMVEKLGYKWSQISKSLSGRTDNSIKNRYNSSLRRSHEEGRFVPQAAAHKVDESIPSTPPGSPTTPRKRPRGYSEVEEQAAANMLIAFASPLLMKTLTPKRCRRGSLSQIMSLEDSEHAPMEFSAALALCNLRDVESC